MISDLAGFAAPVHAIVLVSTFHPEGPANAWRVVGPGPVALIVPDDAGMFQCLYALRYSSSNRNAVVLQSPGSARRERAPPWVVGTEEDLHSEGVRQLCVIAKGKRVDVHDLRGCVAPRVGTRRRRNGCGTPSGCVDNWDRLPRVRRCAATLGCGVQRFQR